MYYYYEAPHQKWLAEIIFLVLLYFEEASNAHVRQIISIFHSEKNIIKLLDKVHEKTKKDAQDRRVVLWKLIKVAKGKSFLSNK